MFTRTERGLSNEHLFYDVEFIVYCEGETVEGESSSLDEVFWTAVFSNSGRAVKCKSLGGKDALVAFAAKVLESEIENVVIAMDRDYDHLTGNVIDHRKVVYTYGYSWESDAIYALDFDLVIAAFVNLTDPAPIRGEFQSYFKRQSSSLRRPFALDFKYIGCDTALFDRGKPLSIVAFGGTSAPYVKNALLLKNAAEIGNYQTAPLPAATYRGSCGMRCFYGKTVARLVYQWFVFRTKKLAGKRNIPYDAFMSLALARLNIGTKARDIDDHYSAAIAAI